MVDEPVARGLPSAEAAEQTANRIVTTALDTVAVLSLAAGVGLGLGIEVGMGWWGLAVAGAVLGLLSTLAGWLHTPREAEPEPGRSRQAPPGPEDPGNIHLRGPQP